MATSGESLGDLEDLEDLGDLGGLGDLGDLGDLGGEPAIRTSLGQFQDCVTRWHR